MEPVNKHRILKEIYALNEVCDTIDHDLQDGVIHLQVVPVPEGWSPATVDVLLELPTDYPYIRPALFVSEELEVNNGPCHLYWDCDRDGWKQFDLKFLLRNWDPARHTTVTVMRHFKAELRYWGFDDF